MCVGIEFEGATSKWGQIIAAHCLVLKLWLFFRCALASVIREARSLISGKGFTPGTLSGADLLSCHLALLPDFEMLMCTPMPSTGCAGA